MTLRRVTTLKPDEPTIVGLQTKILGAGDERIELAFSAWEAVRVLLRADT
jgi:hypothetical protein